MSTNKSSDLTADQWELTDTYDDPALVADAESRIAELEAALRDRAFPCMRDCGNNVGRGVWLCPSCWQKAYANAEQRYQQGRRDALDEVLELLGEPTPGAGWVSLCEQINALGQEPKGEA